jgi:hypothetical protein
MHVQFLCDPQKLKVRCTFVFFYSKRSLHFKKICEIFKAIAQEVLNMRGGHLNPWCYPFKGSSQHLLYHPEFHNPWCYLFNGGSLYSPFWQNFTVRDVVSLKEVHYARISQFMMFLFKENSLHLLYPSEFHSLWCCLFKGNSFVRQNFTIRDVVSLKGLYNEN